MFATCTTNTMFTVLSLQSKTNTFQTFGKVIGVKSNDVLLCKQTLNNWIMNIDKIVMNGLYYYQDQDKDFNSQWHYCYVNRERIQLNRLN